MNYLTNEEKLLANIQNDLIDLREDIYNHFHTTDAQWRKFTLRVTDPTREGMWVFSVACGYALGGLEGIKKLTDILAESGLEQPDSPKIWFESIPISPRSGKDEGKTHFDLSLGAIVIRDRTQNGIKLDIGSPSWVCFCEAKIDSDIARNVTYNPTRNQLIRIIENAICFQDSGIYSDKVFVTIITPKEAFKSRRSLLNEKFERYSSNPKFILDDIQKCALNINSHIDWKYPDDIEQRIDTLNLKRAYFEDLIWNLPKSKLSQSIEILWDKLYM